MFPLSIFPAHSLPLAIDLLENPKTLASQLGCASDLLASVAAPSVIRFAKNGEMVKGWNINLESLACPFSERLGHILNWPARRIKISRLMKQI